MSEKKWHSGPPPSVGWWPASDGRMTGLYRWWDGQFWSIYVTRDSTAHEAGKAAMSRNISQTLIRWQTRPANWPARSKT